jgi:hypothetical protein
MRLRAAAIAAVLGASSIVARDVSADLDPATLPPVSYQPGGPAYWDRPQFANALLSGDGWNQNWTRVPIWNVPQFDANGYPRSLVGGQALIAVIGGLHSGYGAAPPGWPDVQ